MKRAEGTSSVWDVVVIGGGPSGMMAAGRAAELGKKVLLLEKNPTLGKKLLITGGGRCNVTNNKPEVRTMLEKYKGNGKFLFSAFSQFGVADAISFFESRGMPLKEENDGRLFPVSNTAQSVFDVLVAYMQEGGVTVRTKASVDGLFKDLSGIRIRLVGKEEILARACVVATGGTSRPETGSSGEGFLWLKKLEHTVVENDFALVPIALADTWVKKLGGVTLTDIKLTVFRNSKKESVHKGKVLFTHFGVSGPTILNMSKEVGELSEYGDVTIMLDLFPAADHGALKQQLQRLFEMESNKKVKNSLSELVPSAFVSALLEIAGVDGDTPCHSLLKEHRAALVALMKGVPLHVKGLLGAEKAVISSGGVALKEVDFKTMQSRQCPGLYLVGDVLNIDRPSGGYSLQLAWTTGFVAGNHS